MGVEVTRNTHHTHTQKKTCMVWFSVLHIQWSCKHCLLTGSPTVTTPRSFTTLECLNCPLMAASCRNLTLSSCEALDCSVFTATSTAPAGDCHIPLFTVPNWPEPRCSVILKKKEAQNYNSDVLQRCTVSGAYELYCGAHKLPTVWNTYCIWCLGISRYFLSASCW